MTTNFLIYGALFDESTQHYTISRGLYTLLKYERFAFHHSNARLTVSGNACRCMGTGS